MKLDIIKHKLEVFISSKCGGKYTIVRKALQKLLEETGLVSTYAYETEPASSINNENAYLSNLDHSDLIIILIDNKDGATSPVLAEEKRAKDMKLRMLYVFCDEDEKAPTPMQESIIVSQSQKFIVVHEFSDIAIEAFDSVMQDLISVYRIKESLFSNPEAVENLDSAEEKINYAGQTIISKVSGSYDVVHSVLAKGIYYHEAKEPSPIDSLYAEHLKCVLLLKPFEEKVLDQIYITVCNGLSESMKALLSLRCDAQKHYYKAEYEQCKNKLQESLSFLAGASDIPVWIANDIAIDLRHVIGLIDEQNSIFSFDNIGQKYIDESIEPVYYPMLDRHVDNMHERIVEWYYNEINRSPYSVQFGGLSSIIAPLADAFALAMQYGSIVQTIIIRDRMISVYQMLCVLYADHAFSTELIRLLVLGRKAKQIDTVIRTYYQAVDVINSHDISAFLECIDREWNSTHRLMCKYLLVSRLGNYMDDESFLLLYKELSAYALSWADNEKRVYNLKSYIFDFFKESAIRTDGTDTILFIKKVFEKKFAIYYDDCLKLIGAIDFNKAPAEYQSMIKSLLVELVNSDNPGETIYALSSALIRFCKTTSLDYSDLEQCIREKMPSMYSDTFQLEMSINKEEDKRAFIGRFISEAERRNITQGENGSYSGYAYDPLQVIMNIIINDELQYHGEEAKPIIDVCISTLAEEKQTVTAKMNAIRLIQFLYFRTADKAIWNETEALMIENRYSYSKGHELGFFDKSSNQELSFAYELFLSCFYKGLTDSLIEKLYSADTDDSHLLISLCNSIHEFLESAKGCEVDQTLLASFVFYSIMMSRHRERDVRYHATRCIIELVGYDSTKELALKHLARKMDVSSQAEKVAIITRVKELPIDNAYITQIINKGMADNDYIVRFVANRENK